MGDHQTHFKLGIFPTASPSQFLAALPHPLNPSTLALLQFTGGKYCLEVSILGVNVT